MKSDVKSFYIILTIKIMLMNVLLNMRMFRLFSETSQEVTNNEMQEAYGEFVEQIRTISNGNDYSTYWISSRCVQANSSSVSYYVYVVYSSYVNADYLYTSTDASNDPVYAIRPVITLNSSVKLDITDIGDGSSPQTGYSIK